MLAIKYRYNLAANLKLLGYSMKNIEIDEALYHYIASNTQFIGESASSILRRLLSLSHTQAHSETQTAVIEQPNAVIAETFEARVEEDEIIAGVISKDEDSVEKSEVADLLNASVSHNQNESVFNFINKEELAMQRGAVGRFLLILAALYRAHPQQFVLVNDISGRDRLYFANSAEKLDASGSSTKPRQIPDSPFWVITNSNTTRKKMMLTKAAHLLGYTEEDAEKIRELL